MSQQRPLVMFTIDDQPFAIDLEAVERVLNVVEITRVPDASQYMLGLINIQGEVVSIFDCRKKLGFPSREMMLSDQFLVVHHKERRVGLLVDSVHGVLQAIESEIVKSQDIEENLAYVDSVAFSGEKMILILDLSNLLEQADVGAQFC
jgi:purine-binding chemotaxis protein CheW